MRTGLAWCCVIVWLLIVFCNPEASASQETLESERLYLSGSGLGTETTWGFRIDRGRGAGDWTSIPVPAQWELQGFGEYSYGRHDKVRAEIGRYRHSFEVPAAWRDRRVDLVFEGVMTDTSATLNGQALEPVHRGGFTRFSYRVERLIDFDRPNLLEVTVSEASNDRSVEQAERSADYWVFGGIYRPVYLESRPLESIEYLAIDARHDGRLEIFVERTPEALKSSGSPNSEECRVRARVERGGEALPADWVEAAEGRTLRLNAVFESALPWSAEHPNLYDLVAELVCNGVAVHRTVERFGFRTVEIRPSEGLYINGKKVLLKGINRHSFWPVSGRTLNRDINVEDAALIKSANANAVRTSHYPPDVEFLNACDEIGLYVLNELPGWHDGYRAGVGSRLIEEMVRRDANHPSVILWANGNEGGWTSLLDAEFGKHDPQERPVIHPGGVFSGLNTTHYVSYAELESLLDNGHWINRLKSFFGPLPLILPTEMLHGLYDGGLGAGLADYWHLLATSARGVGAFLWAFLDEGIVRTDRQGELDTFGNYAPDGLVDPFRRQEASYSTMRRIWSPVQVQTSSNSPYEFGIGNHFVETDLNEMTFRWSGWTLPGPFDRLDDRLVFSTEAPGPSIQPGRTVRVEAPVPSEVQIDVLSLVVSSTASGRELGTWVFETSQPRELQDRWRPAFGNASALRVVDGPPAELPFAAAPEILAPSEARDRDRNPPDSEWSVAGDGWIRFEFEYPSNPAASFEGVGFKLTSGDTATSDPFAGARLEFLGEGPWPVWANRLAGGELGRWRRALEAEASPSRQARGFYAGVRWMILETGGRRLVVMPETENLYIGVSSPSFPDNARNARALVPPADMLTFLHKIPPIGTKFHAGEDLRPKRASEARDDKSPGRRRGTVWFRVLS